MKIRNAKNIIINYINNTTIIKKLIISFSILIVLTTLLIGLTSTYFSRKYLIESEKNNIKQSMEQLNNSLDYFFEIYMDRVNLVFMSDELQKIMDTQVTNIGIAADINKKIQLLCSYIENDNKYPEIKNSYYYGGNILYKLYLDNNTINAFGGDTKPLSIIKNEKWYKEFESETRAFKWQSGEKINGVSYISLSRRLIHFEDSKTKGLIKVYIPVNRIKGVITSNVRSKFHKIYYVDDSYNKIISVGNEELNEVNYIESLKNKNLPEGINTTSINGNKFLVGSLKSSSTGWRILYLVPFYEITKKTQSMLIITAISTLIALTLCIFIAYIISNIFNKRIKTLVKKANMIGEHNLNTGISLEGNDELGQLDKHFDNMVKRLNDLIEEEYKSEIMINKVKLELLQEQINPHLLYNTLAMVSYTAKKEGKMEIVDIAENLSNFYKGILSRGKTISSFKEELDMVKRYIDLMRYVYNIEIDTIFEVEEEIYEFYTLKLLLQPIVENAVVHGIKPKKSGIIVISIYTEDDKVKVVVSDDGIGIKKDIADMFNTITSYKDIDKGYGLSNVIKRIKLFFGDKYGIKVVSKLNEGTNIIINVPIIKKGDIDNIGINMGVLKNRS